MNNVKTPDPYYVTPSAPLREPIQGHEDVRYQKHYASTPIEPKDISFVRMTDEQLEGAFVWNVNKYLWRYKDKGGVRDIEAALVYLGWLHDLLENPARFRKFRQEDMVNKLSQEWDKDWS